jgi:hypothetical protein
MIEKDLSRRQTLRENLIQLRREGLTGLHPLRTFFSRRILPLRLKKTKMWPYLGCTYPDHPSPEELGTAEVETWIRKVLDSAVVPPTGAGPDPL